jgi:hypothetical protein
MCTTFVPKDHNPPLGATDDYFTNPGCVGIDYIHYSFTIILYHEWHDSSASKARPTLPQKLMSIDWCIVSSPQRKQLYGIAFVRN